jgi:hypothetical protein
MAKSDRVAVTLTACAQNTTLDDLLALLEFVRDKARQASNDGNMLAKWARPGAARQKLEEASEKLDELSKALTRVDTVAKDIRALCQIFNALYTIEPDDFRNRPEAAARAFEDFFLGVGRLCRHSEILKIYAPFFEGFKGFFTFAVALRRGTEGKLNTTAKGGSNFAGDGYGY